jgi:rhodanese-related sulfurtransferase
MDWEPSPAQAQKLLIPENIVVDIRNSADFKRSHLDGSFNLDVGADSRPNPYKDSNTLVWLFDALKARLSVEDPDFGFLLEGRTVVLLSRDGNVSRLACSILRKRGVEAFSVTGGVDAMVAEGLWPIGLRAQL